MPEALISAFLGELRTEIAAVRKAVGADDRERHVMLHAGGRLGGEQVAARGFEELQDRTIVERGRVRHVDDDLGADERFGQPLARDGVDARGGRRREDLVAVPAEPVDELRCR